MDRAGASRALTRVAHAAGITRAISPHGLRRTFCTTGLVAGIGIRDMQYVMRQADRPTTMRYHTHQGQPRPSHRPRRRCLPGRHEHRLKTTALATHRTQPALPNTLVWRWSYTLVRQL